MESEQYRLPEGYDLNKEPRARYGLTRNDGYGPMSSRTYVLVMLDGEPTGGRVPIKDPTKCDHGTTICTGGYVEDGDDGKSCVEVWQYDYSVLWSRNQGGRRMIRQLGVDADKHQNPDHPANRYSSARVAAEEARSAALTAEREADNKAARDAMDRED